MLSAEQFILFPRRLLENLAAFKTAASDMTLSEWWDRLQKNVQQTAEDVKKQMGEKDKKNQ